MSTAQYQSLNQQPYSLSPAYVHGLDSFTGIPGYVDPHNDIGVQLQPLVTSVPDVNKAVELQTVKDTREVGPYQARPNSPTPFLNKQDMDNEKLWTENVTGYGMPIGNPDGSGLDTPQRPKHYPITRWSATQTPGYYLSNRDYGHGYGAERLSGDAGSMAGLSQQGRVVAPGGQAKRFREMNRVIPLPLVDTIGSPVATSFGATAVRTVPNQDGGLQWW